MSTATVTSKGQITIPKPVRQRLGVKPGDRVEFIEIDDGVFHLLATSREIGALKGIVAKPARPVSVGDMNESIESRGHE